MKQITIINNVSIEKEVDLILSRVGITAFTRVPRCNGQGPVSGPRHDNHTWPGYNVLTIAVVSDATATAVMEALQSLRNSPEGAAGVYAYTMVVDSILQPPQK